MPLLVSPNRLNPPTGRMVFLAGSIEMGRAEDWQQGLAKRLLAIDPSLVVANPRRFNWDASWVQSIDNPPFNEQVNWELDHIERSELVVFHFQPGTQSPITLLELGKHLARPDAAQATLVSCLEGFWRKGNVDIVCQRAGVRPPFLSLEDLTLAAEDWARNVP